MLTVTKQEELKQKYLLVGAASFAGLVFLSMVWFIVSGVALLDIDTGSYANETVLASKILLLLILSLVTLILFSIIRVITLYIFKN